MMSKEETDLRGIGGFAATVYILPAALLAWALLITGAAIVIRAF